MTRDEFKTEVLNSNICPENFEEIYEGFMAYQQKALDTLSEFHRVCEKCGIRYQLAYGSLLGAVRDNGQIPWDYDIDVFVPFKEREALVEALKKELDEKYYFYCPEVNSKCRHYIMRLAPKGYRTEVLHVDVFYLIGAPEDENERKQFAERVKFTFNTRYAKLIKAFENSNGRVKTLGGILYRKLKCLKYSLKDIDREYYELCTKYDYDTEPISVSAEYGSVNRYYESDKMRETMLYKTENGEFRIPVNYEYVLSKMYSDYKKIYPLESRLNEMLNHYNWLKSFEGK